MERGPEGHLFHRERRTGIICPVTSEIPRRYDNIRAAMREQNVDALIVCGNQYAGFEGAVFYVSGFEIVHRYVYVLIPLEGDPTLLSSRRRRAGSATRRSRSSRKKSGPRFPAAGCASARMTQAGSGVAVYGLDYIMAVRDYRELQQGPFELVPFDFHFDMARAVKSDEELAEVRDAMHIIHEGFWAMLDGFAPGKTEAEIMAPGGGGFLRPRRRPAHDEHRALRRKRRSRGALQGSGTSPGRRSAT